MMLFVLIWLALVLAAAGLAVGALRGRPLPGGPCAVRAVAGDAACEACPAHDALGGHAAHEPERSAGGPS